MAIQRARQLTETGTVPAACLTATMQVQVLLTLCEYLHHLQTFPDTSCGEKLTKRDFPQGIV